MTHNKVQHTFSRLDDSHAPPIKKVSILCILYHSLLLYFIHNFKHAKITSTAAPML